MTKQVGATLKDPGGNGLASIPVDINLVMAQGWGKTSKIAYSKTYRTATDSSGNWSAILPENDLINPLGTLYQIVERLPTQYGGQRIYTIQVLSTLSAGLNQVMDLLVPALNPVGEVNNYITLDYANATYATLGTSGSAGPAGPPGPPGGTPLPLIYPTEALLLADTTQPAGTYAYATDTQRFWRRQGTTWKPDGSSGTSPVDYFDILLSGPTTSGTTPLGLGTYAVAAIPYPRFIFAQAEINKTQTVVTDVFELQIGDGTTTRVARSSGVTTDNSVTTPSLIVAIAANATPTISTFLTRISGTGTATVAGGGNLNRLQGLIRAAS